MATIGLKNIYTGIKNADGTTVLDVKTGLDETGVFTIDTDTSKGNLGSKTANITNLSGTPSKVTGNNKTVAVSNPPSSPSVAIDSNLINYIAKQKMLGRVSDGFGGYTDGIATVECGLIVESQTPITYKSVFYAFGAGIYNEAGQNIQTNTDTAETREDDNLTYTALDYEAFGGKPFKIWYEEDSNFDRKRMFDEVFPGQTLVAAETKPSTGGSETPKA